MPVYIRVRLPRYACVYVYTRQHPRTVQTPRHTRAHTDTCVYVSMPFERVCLYPRVCVYIDANTRAYTYGHAYMHMRMRSRSLSPPLPSPPLPHESSGPGVYGAALGTGGRDKVPGALPASRRWGPLSAAVISSPLIGLFCHQVSADTVSLGVCDRGLWVSGRTRGSGLLGRQLVPGSALAAGAARLGLCAGSCVVSSG